MRSVNVPARHRQGTARSPDAARTGTGTTTRQLPKLARGMDRRLLRGGRKSAVFAGKLFEEFLRVQRGHATRAGRGNGLAIAVILHVSSDEHARDGGLAAAAGKKVAVGIGFNFALEGGGVGIVADGHKNAV